MILTREDLHRLVWAMPVLELARLLGVSATSVRKACVSRNVPMPDRAFWSTKRAGYEAHLLPLPEPGTERPPWTIGPDFVAEIDVVLSGGAVKSQGETVTKKVQAGPSGPLDRPGTDHRAAQDKQGPLALAMTQELAAAFQVREAFERLKRTLEVARETVDPATSAVLALWITRADAHMASVDPVATVLQACREVASGSRPFF